MTYSPPPFPAGLAPFRNVPSARPLQALLKLGGYMPSTVEPSDNYGPQTQLAVSKFYGSSQVAIDPIGWERLNIYVLPDPDHNMHHTLYGGHVVNERTRFMLAEVGNYSLAQGSYNPGVGASAGTHDGGGVVDVSVTGLSAVQRFNLVFRLREFGFAAWLRTPAEGFPFHIHAVAIGDEQMSPAAHAQVVDYFAGRNGLANRAPDSFTGGRPYPKWALKYK